MNYENKILKWNKAILTWNENYHPQKYEQYYYVHIYCSFSINCRF